jgi:hypothetical protein
MKNTIRVRKNGNAAAPTPQAETPNGISPETQGLSRDEEINFYRAVNRLETSVVESNTFTKLMTEHFLNQAHHSKQIEVDQEYENLCFGCAVLAETIGDRLKLASKAIRDTTLALTRKNDAAHSKSEVAS